jgi:glycosyltransferase involved in cell wall biosynthesis
MIAGRPPAVSVVIAVRNGAAWVGEAVGSVLAQTDGDHELIIVDDGSTDATADLLAGIADPRLRVLRQEAAGLTRALNRALGVARADLVARLDADDLMLPERLARQRAFLTAHPDVGVLGTAAREVDAAGLPVSEVRPPLDDAAIRRALIRRNPFVHSSVVMRRQVVEAAGGYDEAVAVAQDYELWLRLSRAAKLANLPEPLVLRRLARDRVSVARDTERLRTEVRVKLRALRSGAYPPWCAIYLLKPLVGLALPARARRLVRGAR